MATVLTAPKRVAQHQPQESRRALSACLLVLWTAFLFLYGLNAGELYRNEGLRARIAQEMLADGDWIVPHLYGEPIFTKPPLMYWAICLVSWPFGAVSTATARLPSVLAGLATVVLFFWYFRRCLGGRGGYYAALLLPLCIFWLDKVPTAEIDAVQVAWVAAAILFFLRALEEEEVLRRADARRLGWWLLSGLCLAGGTLTKWTAPAFFYGTALPLLWWRRELRVLTHRGHVLALALALGLVSTWILLAVAQTGADIFWQAVLREAAPRLVPGENPKPYPWLETLLHPSVVLLASLPCSLALLLLMARRRRQDLSDSPIATPTSTAHAASRRLYQALHCWLWPNLLFWTLHPDHTLRNRAPLFPALAGLAVFALLAWEDRRLAPPRRLGQPRRWLSAFLVVWLILKLVHVEVVLAERARARNVREAASLLARCLPPANALLYLFRLKDECLMFYLGQAAARLPSPDALPPGSNVFCILTKEEWRGWPKARPARLVTQALDGQGEPIFLVQVGL